MVYFARMNILVRLPNWLGDMVMSASFIKAVQSAYPDAAVSVIAKKGMEGILDFFPPLKHRFLFSKQSYNGITGMYRFGRMIRNQQRFDIFFCLPDSFSSAFIGWSTGATARVGYRKEARNFLLTHHYQKDHGRHRIEQYWELLAKFSGHRAAGSTSPPFNLPPQQRSGLLVNIHSEATSRRIPREKAAALLDLLCVHSNEKITLIGGPNDARYTSEVIALLQYPQRVTNIAGTTTLPELIQLFSRSLALLSSDSGPAHLANACSLPVLVLFGAGDENETRPFYDSSSEVIRLGKLSCEPCRRNECKFGIPPPCLTDLDNEKVINGFLKLANA